MTSLLRTTAVALALTAISPLASAQTTTTTTTTIETRGPLKLTRQQRTVIQRTVTRERRVAPPAELQISVGAEIPSSVELSAFPDAVYVEVPVLKRYKYVYVNNQLVLVDPETSQIVEIIQE